MAPDFGSVVAAGRGAWHGHYYCRRTRRAPSRPSPVPVRQVSEWPVAEAGYRCEYQIPPTGDCGGGGTPNRLNARAIENPGLCVFLTRVPLFRVHPSRESLATRISLYMKWGILVISAHK